jgi:S1-C subfamily serine protease
MKYPVGQQVPLTVQRGDKTLTLTVTLTERPH